jgi:hypothetical protein
MVVPKRAKKWGPLVCEKKAADLTCGVIRLLFVGFTLKKAEKERLLV